MEEKSFVFGVAVSDYNFTGRKEEIARLTNNFREGINTILISPRRWGKTSLVKYVCNHLSKDEALTVYLDMFSCKNEYEFYNALAEAILKQTASRTELWMDSARDFLVRLSPKISISPEPNSDVGFSLGVTPSTHSPEEVLHLVETVAERKKKRIVVCIDEFQQFGEFPDSLAIQRRMRSVWQQQHLTSYCLFGSKRHLMSSLFQRRNMPFYQFGETMFLKRIPTEDWISYITSHFERRNRHISSELAAEICKKVENFSSYVQQLSWLVFTRLNEGETATETHLERAVGDLLDSNELLFMQQIEPLTAYQMNFLRAIMAGVHSDFGVKNVREKFQLGSNSNIRRLQDALLEKDLIDIEGEKTYLADPVFGLWFRRREQSR